MEEIVYSNMHVGFRINEAISLLDLIMASLPLFSDSMDITFIYAMVPYATLRATARVTSGYGARSMSTYRAVKLKKDAAKDHANDGTGKHTHVVEQHCVQTDCDKKKCPTLCDQALKDEIKGHQTHKLPIGRFGKYIASEDANGDSKTQYFVSTNKPHTITAQEKQTYGTQIKTDTLQQKFIEKYADKYDK